jgi:hypothetical protein
LNIALTDGTTRTSVNAAFQIVPIEDRLAAQAVVEGIGVPVAIGATGAVLLVMNVLGLGIGAVIAFGVALSLIWTASGVAMYRSYRRALGDEMSWRSLVAYEIDEDDVALQALLSSDDARDVRLGLDLLPRVVSAPSAEALRQASDHEDPEVRVRALIQLAAHGDARARAEAGRLAAELALSTDTADRCAAAVALGSRDVVTAPRSMLVALLNDPDPKVRAAALDAVVPEDAGEEEVVRRVVTALEEPRTAGSATAAIRRLGNSAVPLLAAAVGRDGASRRPPLIRAAANAAAEHGLAVIEPALRDGDRVVVLAALDALDSANGAGVVPPDFLDEVFHDAAAHAARALAARTSLLSSDGSLQRALEDETDLARRLVIAVLALRHGNQVRDAVRVVDGAVGQRRALGIEALDVLISREEAAVALPLVRRDLAPEEQSAALGHVQPDPRSEEEWIADLAEDPEGVWRSSWVALCARHASGR